MGALFPQWRDAVFHWIRRRVNRLFLRILLINFVAFSVPLFGLFFLGAYRDQLIQTEQHSLQERATLIASGLANSSTYETATGRRLDRVRLRAGISNQIERGIIQERVLLFSQSEYLVTDSKELAEPVVSVRDLGKTKVQGGSFLSVLARSVLIGRRYSLFEEHQRGKAVEYQEVSTALQGNPAQEIRMDERGNLLLSAAAPITFYRKVIGVLMLIKDGKDVEEKIAKIQHQILLFSLIALGMSILLSFYLARTIATPIRMLARSTRRVKLRRVKIPDYSGRKDEIGELSLALRDMTEDLWDRMGATEAFAADVAHELKNPLSSLRSALETLGRLEDHEKREKLTSIALKDIGRMDRLISDISSASRLDAELAREELSTVNLKELLTVLVGAVEIVAKDRFEIPPVLTVFCQEEGVKVIGLEERLGQVFYNLLTNALSFSPLGGEIKIQVKTEDKGGAVSVRIIDDGPGIPKGKEEKIFERFFTDRPSTEGFGNHSGLGLSISKQIVLAHAGKIFAGNRKDGKTGAVFTVILQKA